MSKAITFLLLTGLMSSSLIVPSVLTFFLHILKYQVSFLSLISAPFCCLSWTSQELHLQFLWNLTLNLIGLPFNLKFVGGDIVFLIFNFHFVVVYLICFYMWLRILTSRKVTIYSDGDDIIIIIIGFLGLRFKLVLRSLRWYFVGCIGISLVALVFRWLLSPR